MFLTDRPWQAKWLAPGEREWLAEGLRLESSRKQHTTLPDKREWELLETAGTRRFYFAREAIFLLCRDSQGTCLDFMPTTLILSSVKE